MSEVKMHLELLGYRQLDAKKYDKQKLSLVPDWLDFSIPDDYKKFNSELPFTGVFDKCAIFKGVESSPWADDGIETLEVL